MAAMSVSPGGRCPAISGPCPRPWAAGLRRISTAPEHWMTDMDDIVKQALAKWPNVPACYGWLGLDARGNWFMRDERAQALGPFAGGSHPSKGSMLKHDKLIDFIGRNYQSDAGGRWFFQNGPQCVYVELEATPLIWRV